MLTLIFRAPSSSEAEPGGPGCRSKGMKNTQATVEKHTEAATGLPVTVEGVRQFLAGHRVSGIGPAYAGRITDALGVGAIERLRDQSYPLPVIKGVGEARLASAAGSLRELPDDWRVIVFLYSCGVSDMYIERILDRYRRRTREVILNDPYGMVEDVWQLSFFTADKVGRQLGIASDDIRRLQGALVTAVKHASEEGHLFATPEDAVERAASMTGVDRAAVREAIAAAVESGRLVSSRGGLYLPVFYKAEKEGARRLGALTETDVTPVAEGDIPDSDGRGHTYSPMQRSAIRMALDNPVSVLTGGPGSGKTTVLRGVIDILEKQGKRVTLCAPTGRAAKRMSMLTGREASTIHRLLGYVQGHGYDTRVIDTDVLVIDEGSMMEQVLFNHLLEALRPGTRVIMVGDADQLPAIGAGDVLRDLIASGTVPVAHLNENFRQGEGSLIASGARAINAGEMPETAPDRDLMIVAEESPKSIHDRIISLMTEELPASRGVSSAEILVVTPQQIGPLGARQLNIDLQERLNPAGPALRRGGTVMRLGDPVMQTANSRERGVYNGETGRITAVDPETQTLEVTYSDGRKSTYGRADLSELVLAYATTVHKLQGSEVKHMIFPVTMAHKPMLYRNLLYTGVSRATDLCVLVGEEEALRYAVGNNPATERNSNFRYRLQPGLHDKV